MLDTLRAELQRRSLPTNDALGRLIYVIGTPRGGTTMLFNCINLHDGILGLPANSHFVNHVWRYRRRIHTRLLRIIHALPEYYDETVLANRLDEVENAAFHRHVTEVFRHRQFSDMYQLYPIALALGEPEAATDPVLGWSDKMTSTDGARTILRHMPDARLVLLTRDPRAAVSSLARRAMRKEGQLGDHFDPVALTAEAISWRRLTQDMMRLRRLEPTRTMLVRYEDFVRQPVETLERIFTFAVGKAPERDLLAKRLDAMAYWSSNDPGEAGRGISTAAIDRWRKSVDPATENLISAITWKTARKLGYDVRRASSGGRVIGPAGSSVKVKVRTGLKLAYLGAREGLVRPIALEQAGS